MIGGPDGGGIVGGTSGGVAGGTTGGTTAGTDDSAEGAEDAGGGGKAGSVGVLPPPNREHPERSAALTPVANAETRNRPLTILGINRFISGRHLLLSAKHRQNLPLYKKRFSNTTKIKPWGSHAPFP